MTLDACVAASPDKLALTAVRVKDGEGEATTVRFTYRELGRMADRIAVGLARLGVGRNDVVACQLPNWWQFTLTYLACSRIGAVMNPLMHIFRERELSFMLRHGEAKVLVVPERFRGFDFEQMATGLQAGLPDLAQVVVVGGSGANSFEALLTGPAWENEPDAAQILQQHRPGPDDVTQLIYTSGTTGEPKGVMHSANTTMANIVPYAQRLGLGSADVVLMASPMAHQTGFMYGLMMPIVLQASVVLQDIWEPKQAIASINAEGVSFTMASTPFLSDLSKTVAESGTAVPTLRAFLCAGAPIPGALVEQARQALGAKIVSAWGMTENGAVTLTRLDDDEERSIDTDGCPLPGVELKVVDVDGLALPAGEVGKLLLRACSNFGGYLKRPQLNGTDADDWFDTGDLARIDERRLRAHRRAHQGRDHPRRREHPGGRDRVAAVPPPRRGHGRRGRLPRRAPGRARLRGGGAAGRDGGVDLPSIVAFLKAQKVALQYIPERLVVRESMPSTPSGKIQKFKLRDLLRADESGAPAA